METKKKGRKRLNQAAFDKIERKGNTQSIIKRSEWKLMTPPGKYILRQYLGKEYIVSTLADDSGWIITPDFK